MEMASIHILQQLIYNLCIFHSDKNLEEVSILDGHNLHFSKCFKKYNSEINNFIKLWVG